jgi:hypothetical protein
MTNAKDAMLVRRLREPAHRLAGSTRDYDPLLELIGDARFVLLERIAAPSGEVAETFPTGV